MSTPCANATTDPSPALEILPLDLPLDLPPDLLRARLADLIRAAVNQGTAAVAETIVRYFQALALHPELAANLDERAAYCRGAHHWRGLAALASGRLDNNAGQVPAGVL
jgi:hypothetical protein